MRKRGYEYICDECGKDFTVWSSHYYTFKRQYQGKTYFFCCNKCYSEFEKRHPRVKRMSFRSYKGDECRRDN